MQGEGVVALSYADLFLGLIYALHSGSGTRRAWQALPRHLRRRAASHDVRRVPVRLREKARAEVRPPD